MLVDGELEEEMKRMSYAISVQRMKRIVREHVVRMKRTESEGEQVMGRECV